MDTAAGEEFLRCLLAQTVIDSLGNHSFPRLLGRVLGMLRAPGETENKLHEIPSQTSPEERRFLFNYFARFWSGEHDVLEIGPFMGGTTRAIALGMLMNPRNSKAGCILTIALLTGVVSSC